MGLFFEIGLAAALAVDACTVSLALALALGGLSRRQGFRLVWHFALFQALMPVLGWFGGRWIENWIRAWDHWLAFGLLLAIGLRMIAGAFGSEGKNRLRGDPTRGWSLVLLSVATSIDALAVGLSIGVLGRPIWRPAALIGIVTALMTLATVLSAGRIRMKSTRWAESLGGVILVLLGCLILIEHLRGG